MKKKILMLATTVAMIEQFNRTNIEILNQLGYSVDVIGNPQKGNPISQERLAQFEKWINEQGGEIINYPATRNPFDLINNLKAVIKTIKLIKQKQYAFIHCHNPIGSVIGRIAAHITQTKIIYTAHGFHFYKGAKIINWLFYYPVEKFLSKWTDVLILINKEDFTIAQMRFKAKKTVYIPGIGIDLEKMKCVNINGIDSIKREEIIEGTAGLFIITTVCELIKRKNLSANIKALSNIKRDYPDQYKRIRMVICGKGPLREKLERMVNDLGLRGHVIFLGFRNDVTDILKCSDLFLFMSFQEGLPVAMMEAMASGLPIICSNIRGNHDLVNGKNGVLIKLEGDYPTLVSREIIKIMNNKKMQREYGRKAYESIHTYDIKNISKQMTQIYLNLLLG